MPFRALFSIRSWSGKHRPQIVLANATGLSRLGTYVAYVVLTVVIAETYSPWLSGLIIGGLNFYQALLTDPLAGGIADRFGSKSAVIVGYVLAGAVGLAWIVFPPTSLAFLLVTGALLFASYSFRDEIYAYLLRMSDRDEGGFVFGVAENIFSVMAFLSTLAIPFFIAPGRWHLAGALLVASAAAAALLATTVRDDRTHLDTRIRRFTPLASLRAGWNFVRVNHWFPVLQLGNAAFEGLFYGAIWFVIPLQIADGQGGWAGGLTLGIYELVTILGAAYAGYLADRYRWSRVNAIGWTLAAFGAVLLLFSSTVWWLVLIGAVIAIGNNLFAFASSHALEANDIDHQEDGAFVGLHNLVSDLGYGIAPLVIGLVYARGGFAAGMGFATATTVVLACLMIPLTRHLARRSR